MTAQEPPPYPEASQATTALVLGILSVIGCFITGPFAWSIGNQEIRAIDEGRRNPQNRGQAVAGKILGIIGTIFLVLGILALMFLVLGVMAFWVESS